MDSRRIRNFLAVVETGSIARAAALLHVAQPALSAQMQRLEEMVGCQLLSRSSRGVTPTAAGIEFCKRARHALTALDDLEAIGREAVSAPAGRIVVGVSPSTAHFIAVPLLSAAHREYPQIRVCLQESPSTQLGELLMRRRVDLVVLFSDQLEPGMRAIEVLQEDLFAIGHAVDRPEMRFEVLARQPLVMAPRPNTIWNRLDAAAAPLGLEFDVVAEVASPHTMVELARGGLGLTVLPWSMLGIVAAAGVAYARIVEPAMSRNMAIATAASGVASPPLIAIRSLLAATLKDLVVTARWPGARLDWASSSADG